MKNKTKNIARKSITAILFAVMVIATLTVSPALAIDDPITVDPNSSIKSEAWIYVIWGHWNWDQKSIVVPGSDTAYATHSHGAPHPPHPEDIKSTTTYTATPQGACQLDFNMTMDNWLIWGGRSQSQAELVFSVVSNTDYDISGSYTTNANQWRDFNVSLKDLGTGTFIFNHAGTPGTLSGSNLTGTLPSGDYEFRVFTRSASEGPWTWPGYPWKYGPVSGGPDQGTGSVHLGLATVDTTAPEISVTVSPDTLWPPNHKMVDITATVTVSDNCDPTPTVVLTSVTSNEPDDAKGKGDGKTVNDIQGVEIGTEDYEFQLRAERAGKGDGRIYTITYTATDESGNSASASATVVVPHDMG